MLPTLSRRAFLGSTAGLALAAPLAAPAALASSSKQQPRESGQPTRFQIACMTLPYSDFPLQRALEGIRDAGYHYVAWGTSHREGASDERTPVVAVDAPLAAAAELATRCRDLGLEPVMMFSTVNVEADDAVAAHTSRILQAEAAGLTQLLTFGHTEGGQRDRWIANLRALGPIARDHGVLIVIKQHGGETGTGRATADIVREVDDEGVWVNYDAGNVMDYLSIDPIPDLQTCAELVRSFCIKDHRDWPRDQDCGPGFGEIDHYRLLDLVAHTGRVMPLCCENIFAPLVPRPQQPEGVDALARRAREYLEVVIAGLQTQRE